MPLRGLMLACYEAVRDNPGTNVEHVAEIVDADLRRTKNALHSLRRRGALKFNMQEGFTNIRLVPGWTDTPPPLRPGPQRSNYARGQEMSRGEWEALIVNYEVKQPGGGVTMFEQYQTSRRRRGYEPEITTYDFGQLMYEARKRRKVATKGRGKK